MPKQLFLDYSNGKVILEEVPYPTLKSNGVIIKTLYSAVSIGTEKLMLNLARKTIIGKALERPDLLKMVWEYAKNEGFLNAYRAAMARLKEPVPLGYSSSGIIIEVGENASNEFQKDDIVACGGHGYASHAETTYVPRTLCTKIPSGVDPLHAAYANIGAIAIHSLRIAGIELGSNVAIIGLGLLGLIAVQAAKAAGANVLGIDIVQQKTKLARELGADLATTDLQNIELISENFTDTKGFDSVIIFASTNKSQPIELAARIARRKGRIVVPGWVKTNIPRNLFYEKELEFIVPRSSGLGIYDPLYEIGRTQHLLEYVRWTAKENMKTFLNLLKEKKINMGPIITNIYPINQAQKVYEKIYKGELKGTIGLAFKYPSVDEISRLKSQVIIEIKPRKKEQYKKETIKQITPKIGFIGAGQHAQGTILPILKKIKGIQFIGVATATPANAVQTAKRWGFKYATTQPEKIIEDPEINAVFITTRHDTHAYYAIKALEAGKFVFVEKPLATTLEQLEQIRKTVEEYPGKLMVGYNRRYSPFIQEAKKILQKRTEPMTILMRINAGYTPQDHWIYDPKQGGGRILSEICHFIDLSIFITDSYITDFTVANVKNFDKYHPTDNISVLSDHSDGSLTSLVYTSSGTRSYPRELIEMFSNQSVLVINNFKSLIVKGKLGKMNFKKRSVDRGHKNMLLTFIKSVRNNTALEQETIKQFIESTKTTILINKSLYDSLNER